MGKTPTVTNDEFYTIEDWERGSLKLSRTKALEMVDMEHSGLRKRRNLLHK
jgi:hypothetical protein